MYRRCGEQLCKHWKLFLHELCLSKITNIISEFKSKDVANKECSHQQTSLAFGLISTDKIKAEQSFSLCLKEMFKQLEQLLVPSGTSCFCYQLLNPVPPTLSSLILTRAWEKSATHSGQEMKECKHKAQSNMAGTKVSTNDNHHKVQML